MIGKTFKFCLALGMVAISFTVAQAQQLINFQPGHTVMEVVGQVQNFATTPQTSVQYGYITQVEGLETVFAGTLQNETTALLTFVTQASTVRVITDGSLKIVNRTGSTTIYVNMSPADFSNPSSFSAGIPIQTSTFRQQVILDPTAGTFSVSNYNTIDNSSIFTLNGGVFRLGLRGQSFRTSLYGRLNSAGPTPTGFFAGYAVGVRNEDSDLHQE